MLIAFFVLPTLAYLSVFVLLPRYRRFLPFWGAAGIALVSLLALLYTVNEVSLWKDGDRIVWAGVKSKGAELVVGGNEETAFVGWANGSFAPAVKAVSGDSQTGLTISGGAGFIRDEKNGEYLNGELIAAGETKTLGGYAFKKTESRVCGSYLQVFQNENLLVETNLPRAKKDRVYNLDGVIEIAALNLTPTGVRESSWFCGATSTLSPVERIKRIESLKVFLQDARLLLRQNGEIRILDSQMQSGKSCENPCRLKILWSNSSSLIEFDKSAGRENNLVLRFLPPYRDYSPMPKDPAANRQLVITDRVSPGEYAYTLPLGRRESGEKRKLDLSQMESLDVEQIPEPFEKKIQSACEAPTCKTVEGKSLFLTFYRLKDLPNIFWFVILSLASFGLLLYGLRLIDPQPSPELRCAVAGFVAVVWNFLVLRLMLGMRYAIDPKYFDEHNVGDLTLAFAGLSFLPGFLCLLARLRYDAKRFLEREEASANFRKSQILFVGIVIVFFADIRYVQSLWNDLPTDFAFNLGWKYAGLIGAFFIYLLFYIWVFYRNKTGERFTDDETHPVRRATRFLLLDIWELPQKLVGLSRGFWREILGGEKVVVRRLCAFAVVYFVLGIFGFFLLSFGLKDFLAFFFCWIPVIFLLSAKSLPSREIDSLDHPNRRFFMLILLFSAALLLAILAPLAVEAGLLYAYFAVVFALTLILLKKSGGSRQFGSAALLWVSLGLIIAFTFYLNFFAFIRVTSKFGEAVPRILAYQKGDAFQHYILSADSGTGESPVGLNVYDVTNVYLHTWENKSIAHHGALFGEGFGSAPDRLSIIRADTIQYDSVFSFFIAGDHGFFGGFCLLLLYFMPLLLIYFGNRYACDVGVATALIICVAFCLEGLFHAGMNLGALPFTGRNLPLLSVHSFNADFVRWTILFAFLINALYWRFDENSEAATCLMTDEMRRERNSQAAVGAENAVTEANLEDESSAAAGGKAGKSKKSLIADLKFYRRRFFSAKSENWAQFGVLFAFPLILLLLITFYWFSEIYRNDRLNEFSWGILERDINWAISRDLIRVMQDEREPERECPKIVFEENDFGLKWKGENDFLTQQIFRFNSLSCEERVGEGAFPGVVENLARVTDYGGYQNFLNDLRENDRPARRPRKPNVLAVQRIAKLNDDDLGYGVVFNPDFNIKRSFKKIERRDEVPNFKIGENTKLVGTAWDKGKYVTALDNVQLLPWTEWLPGAFGGEWKTLGSREATKRYGTLTLEERLHTSAVSFVDRKGIELHRQSIAANGRNPFGKLPPRIGLTVLRLSDGNDNGAVLALGGFPRATGGAYWQKVSYGDESLWLPPAQVVEKRFPPVLKRLYGNDRNFELGAVMGSSTKPMLAQAVLSVHSGLNLQDKFRVAGSAVLDDSVFGIKITDNADAAWKGHGSARPWVDFNTFLTESNNRYQVLFGFLGLAESNLKDEPNAANKFIKTEPGKNSGSRLETMNNVVWNKIPKFDERIGFDADHPREMKDLQKTDLAQHLRRMFGIGVFQKDLPDQENDYGSYMNSFWTKNEINDALVRFDGEKDSPRANESLRNSLSPAILPARANFQLNKIREPRDFVSLLLGGGENKWSNVHVSAAFATAVTGKPVLPHIVKNDSPPTAYGRSNDFTELAKIIRPGLENVVFARNGTAHGKLASAGALNFLEALKQSGFQVHAKTGTLRDLGKFETTRLILTIVRYEDAAKTKVGKGLVFSIYAENTVEGTAAIWLGEFLAQNREEISRLLGLGSSSAPISTNRNQERRR